MTTGQGIRWSLSGLDEAVEYCKDRNAHHIRTILADLEEYARVEEDTLHTVRGSIATLDAIRTNALDASLSLKLSALGVLFDQNLFERNLTFILDRARKCGAAVEIDIEGRGLIEITLSTLIHFAKEGFSITGAVQAYLDRTSQDIDTLLAGGVRIRLVKGAYQGDVTEFTEIQERFKTAFQTLAASKKPFSVGTHDPEILAWIEAIGGEVKDHLEVGFLMGLGERTKIDLASQGWHVAEYVPFGQSGAPYTARRERYLTMLETLGRRPVP
ncbi:MAG: proline dehydrogenase family protein [Methanomicrobiales archaeon]|nr:proline dehydrogenase family protein [Methanomicrobiales archaeon]